MVLSSGKVSQARSPPAEGCDPLNATGRLVGPEASNPAPGGFGEVWAREVEFFIPGWEQGPGSGLELGICPGMRIWSSASPNGCNSSPRCIHVLFNVTLLLPLQNVGSVFPPLKSDWPCDLL